VEKAAKVRDDMHADNTFSGLRRKANTEDLYTRFVPRGSHAALLSALAMFPVNWSHAVYGHTYLGLDQYIDVLPAETI
jgi:hypothetical protein